MQVTITAKCSYCARKFVATIAKGFGPQCEDSSARLCCDACWCSFCGYGHVTSEDAETCEETHCDDTPDSGYFDATYADEIQQFDKWYSEV